MLTRNTWRETWRLIVGQLLLGSPFRFSILFLNKFPMDHQKTRANYWTTKKICSPLQPQIRVFFPPLPSVLGEVIVNKDGLGMGNDQLRWIFCTSKNQLKNRQKVEFCSSWKRKRCDQTGSWSCPALPLASCNQTSYPLPPGSTRLLVLLPRSLPSLKSLIPLHGPAAWRVRPFWANSSWDRKVSIKKARHETVV